MPRYALPELFSGTFARIVRKGQPRKRLPFSASQAPLLLWAGNAELPKQAMTSGQKDQNPGSPCRKFTMRSHTSSGVPAFGAEIAFRASPNSKGIWDRPSSGSLLETISGCRPRVLTLPSCPVAEFSLNTFVEEKKWAVPASFRFNNQERVPEPKEPPLAFGSFRA